MSKKTLTPTAGIDDRARDLTRLGLTVRVHYVGPSNTKGGRYVAEVCDDENKSRTVGNSQLSDRCDSTRLTVAEACLTRWNDNRRQWWVENIGSDYRPFSFHAVGFDGSAWLYFAVSR